MGGKVRFVPNKSRSLYLYVSKFSDVSYIPFEGEKKCFCNDYFGCLL